MQFSRARRLSSASTTYHGACLMSVCGEHLVLGPGVLDPLLARLEVHRAQLPAPHRVVDAGLEAPLLLVVGDGEPVLDEDDPGADEHALELRAGAHELLVLLLGAEPHDALDAGAVVPGAVEQDDLAGGGQVGDVALEVPLRALALGRGGQGGDPPAARARALGDALDHAALAGGVAALEEDDDLEALGLHVLLQEDELALQQLELLVGGARSSFGFGSGSGESASAIP